jgi:hypothetical protein
MAQQASTLQLYRGLLKALQHFPSRKRSGLIQEVKRGEPQSGASPRLFCGHGMDSLQLQHTLVQCGLA